MSKKQWKKEKKLNNIIKKIKYSHHDFSKSVQYPKT